MTTGLPRHLDIEYGASGWWNTGTLVPESVEHGGHWAEYPEFAGQVTSALYTLPGWILRARVLFLPDGRMDFHGTSRVLPVLDSEA